MIKSIFSQRKIDAGHQLLFVDTGVEQSDVLLDGLAQEMDVVFLNPQQAPLEQIAKSLSRAENVETVHILSHGEPGALVLAGEKMDAAYLQDNVKALDSIKATLGNSAKLALWACSVSAGAVGRTFVDALSFATGMDVFASPRPVGAADKGGDWNLGINAPFTHRAQAAYAHTLPTFDGSGGNVDGAQTYTEEDNGDGVTMTIHFADDVPGGATATASVVSAVGLGGSVGDVVFNQTANETTVTTVSFDTAVNITSFQYFEADGLASGTFTFTPTGGGSAVVVSSAAFTDSPGTLVSPGDWENITGFTITSSEGAYSPGLDTIVYSIYSPNTAPTVSNAPSDVVLVEDTEGNIDLSAIEFNDDDGDDLTVTLSIDSGVFSAPADGGADVTEVRVNDTTITLTGSAADINTYLDTASNIQYTGAANAEGDDVATLTITPNDGTVDGTADTVNIDITAVNDDPYLSAALPSDLTFTEDTEGNLDIDVSAVDDVDSSTLTVTLSVDSGAFGATILDGAGVGTGVTETRVSDTEITLVGTGVSINSYLDNEDAITWIGDSNVEGDDAAEVTVTANDGDGSGDVTLGTVNLDITAVNDLPISSGGSETVQQEATLTFAAGDFNFSDIDTGDTLASVRIDTLPGVGTLELSGVAVTAGAVIAVGDIANLTFVAPASVTTTSFTYSVNDGTGFATSTATMSLSVTTSSLPPEDISLSRLTINEEQAGAPVGYVSATDPDGDAITFTVNDDRFTVDDNDILRLKPDETLDFETEGSVTVRVTATDTADQSSSSLFTIKVNDVGERIIGTSNGADNLAGGSADDTLEGDSGDDTLDGGNGDDLLMGGSGDDFFEGGNGRDTLIGGEGDDSLSSGSDNDFIFAGLGDLGNDSVNAGTGDDGLGGGSGNDLLKGEEGNDTLWGEVGNDSVFGGDGDDLIYNGEGSDVVYGGTGNDTLWAGSGDDTLFGGDGDDMFIFGALVGNDQLLDFDVEADEIFLRYSGLGFATLEDVQALASETTVDGNNGVLIQLTESSSVFIAGIDMDDFSQINFVL